MENLDCSLQSCEAAQCPKLEPTFNQVVGEREVLVADARRAMEKLTLAFGEDAAARVFSSVVGEARWQTFCRIYGVKQISSRSSFKKHREKGSPLTKIPPATDHGTLFGKEGVPALFVSQPYVLKHAQLLQIMDFCETNNLQVEINPSLSWWFAGKTMAVIFKPKEEAITQEENHNEDPGTPAGLIVGN